MIKKIINKINNISKKPIICIMGPTASGKTATAFEFANQMDCQLISVDSALVYQDMNIGTAKPNQSLLNRYPHDLIDLISPLENYSASNFAEDAWKSIHKSYDNHKIPILIGGTMLYFKSFWEKLDELPESIPEIRQDLELQQQKFGLSYLYEQLVKIDSITAQRLQPNDSQRILRALEIFEITQKPMSSFLNKINNNQLLSYENAFNGIDLNQYELINLAIIPSDRKKLHDRIAIRFDEMLQQNFIDEVKFLRQKYPTLTADHSSMRCVGYRQMWDYLDNLIDYETMREKGIASTRQLAKRQLTWLRNMPQAQFLDEIIDLS